MEPGLPARSLQRLSLGFLVAFLVLAAAGGYWALWRSPALTGRPENPRRLLLEQRVPRGSILDRNGRVLAESVGQPGSYARHYPYPDLAPVLGYVSAQYGRAGLEAAADPVLHGDAGHDRLTQELQAGLLGRAFPGRGVRLSLDLNLQQSADQALGDLTGAVVLLDATSGEVLALASHPTFDANALDEGWAGWLADPRAPLVNRAVMARYQPGGALAPLILAGGLLDDESLLDRVFTAEAGGEVALNGLRLRCRVAPEAGQMTLGQALGLGCPGPLADLGRELGPEALDRLLRDFQLYSAPALPLAVAEALTLEAPDDPAAAAVGQGQLTVTPLHMALVAAALGRDGVMPAPQLWAASQDPAGEWQPEPAAGHPVAVIPAQSARRLQPWLGAGHQAEAVTGAEGRRLAWYLACSLPDGQYAVAVLLEDGDTQAAARIGQHVLDAAAGPAPAP